MKLSHLFSAALCLCVAVAAWGQDVQVQVDIAEERAEAAEEVAEEKDDVAEEKREALEEVAEEEVEAAAAVEAGFGPPSTAPQPTKPESTKPNEGKPTGDKPSEAAEPETPQVPMDPQHIRLHLMDGSVISGKLAVKDITVETKFGSLKVPIASIRSFTPGIDSYPNFEQEVSALIEKLGSDDYAERESARKQLVKMGLPIEAEVKRHLNDSNAERVRHIKAILTEFEQLAEDEDEEAPKSVWIRQDTVETTDFTVVGKIAPKAFEIASTYGPLTIKLSDIRRANREQGAKEEVRKSLSVEGSNLAQISFKTSGIRVERGDKISVTADGQIVMSPWGAGSISTPDGGANFGWYVPNSIYGGALVGKIGDSGQVFKVGAKSTFTADRSGTLQFAIAMQYEYAQGNYQFPGQYNLKIKVEPK